ncbi:hypothetical protein PMAYCL1PPCAC_22146 [Pristionchus mayeri]|uniref:Uncharacterized protein n=1 Tax=Pristionchus mayeri TaxID=1317129 RepID=A0AAN5CVT8_9BILA|nr:hypothetical protein PMAYCL1PPCAC_22146 [Pristionchus mayeri]
MIEVVVKNAILLVRRSEYHEFGIVQYLLSIFIALRPQRPEGAVAEAFVDNGITGANIQRRTSSFLGILSCLCQLERISQAILAELRKNVQMRDLSVESGHGPSRELSLVSPNTDRGKVTKSITGELLLHYPQWINGVCFLIDVDGVEFETFRDLHTHIDHLLPLSSSHVEFGDLFLLVNCGEIERR